jgi:hypothetical protein
LLLSFLGALDPAAHRKVEKTMHPDHLHLIMNACLAAAAAAGAKMAIELAQYVVVAFD